MDMSHRFTVAEKAGPQYRRPQHRQLGPRAWAALLGLAAASLLYACSESSRAPDLHADYPTDSNRPAVQKPPVANPLSLG